MNEQRQPEWFFTTLCLHVQRSSKANSTELLQLRTCELKKIDHQLLLHPGCSQAGGGSTSAVPHGQRHPKALIERLTILSVVPRKCIPHRLQSDQRQCHPSRRHFIFILWGHAKAHQGPQPELALPYATVNQEELLHYEPFLQNYNKSQVPAACSA